MAIRKAKQTNMATRKAKKPTLAKKVAVRRKSAKPALVKKKSVVVKAKTKKPSVAATKSRKSLAKKRPINKAAKRPISRKTKLTNKPRLFVLISTGVICAVVAIAVAMSLPQMLAQNSKDKVLGVTANGAPVNPAFTDPNFYACVLDNLNSNKVEGRSNRTYAYYTTAREMAAMKSLICSGSTKPDNLKITNTSGLELFTGLQDLILLDNKVTYVDISNNSKLLSAYLQHNNISDINVSENTNLAYLDISYNQLTNIDVTRNIALIYLDVGSNKLSNIDITNNTKLKSLIGFSNQLTSIDISNNIKLNMLILSGNQLNNIDVTKNTGLYYLDIDSNKLKDIDVTENTQLNSLRVGGNQLTNIDVTKNTRLYTLIATNNQLSSIDITNNPELCYLSVSYNQIKSLDVTKHVALTMIEITDNQLTSLDILNNPKLDVLVLSNNPLIALKAISSTKHQISSDQKTISTHDTDIVAFLAGIVPANNLITRGVYRNNVAVSSGKLLKGDKLRVSVKNNSKYFDYQIILPAVPTVLSYGNLTSSIDVAKGILYRRPLSFVSSVDTKQITVTGDATITAAFMAYSDGSKINSKHGFLKNGNKLIIKFSDGTRKEFTVKTAWRW